MAKLSERKSRVGPRTHSRARRMPTQDLRGDHMRRKSTASSLSTCTQTDPSAVSACLHCSVKSEELQQRDDCAQPPAAADDRCVERYEEAVVSAGESFSKASEGNCRADHSEGDCSPDRKDSHPFRLSFHPALDAASEPTANPVPRRRLGRVRQGGEVATQVLVTGHITGPPQSEPAAIAAAAISGSGIGQPTRSSPGSSSRRRIHTYPAAMSACRTLARRLVERVRTASQR